MACTKDILRKVFLYVRTSKKSGIPVMAVDCNRQSGLTLVECLISIAIIGLFSTQVVPHFSDFTEKQESVAIANQLLSALRLTRNTAITHQVTTTFCPWNHKQKNCSNNWEKETAIFIDSNRNRSLDQEDRLIRLLPEAPKGSQLHFRSFRSRQYLQITAKGTTWYQNGHFLYCPPSKNSKHIVKIIINVTGRSRLVHDTDKDGIAEDTKGKPLQC